MRVYHNSTRIVEFPSVRIKKHTKDFAWGFYCTDNLMAAKAWAVKKQKYPIINFYDYTESENLNVLQFDKMTDEWLDFIAKCRRGFVHHYDVVKGPMLDEMVRQSVEDYFSGKLSRTEFWEQVMMKTPIRQISFHTIRALRNLKYIGSERSY